MFLESWKIQGDSQYAWITLANSTNPNSLYFEFDTPDDMEAATSITIEFTLSDTNIYTAKTKATFVVQIEDAAFDIDGYAARLKANGDGIPPYLIFNEVDKFDNLHIRFTEEIKYPGGIEFFTSENLGAESFSIKYFPSPST